MGPGAETASGGPPRGGPTMEDPAGLPLEILHLVLVNLPPPDVVACRLVSRRWRGLLTADEVALPLLRRHFPRARESRRDALPPGRPQRGTEGRGARGGCWARTYALVARRYHNLRRAAFHAVDKVPAGRGGRCGVAPWDRHLRVDGVAGPLRPPEPAWSYDQEAGLLAYRAPAPPAARGGPDEADGRAHPFRVLDVAAMQEYRVPFPVPGRVVRRLRLAHGVLIFEWAEARACGQLGGGEPLHRHFVTAYDVGRERGRAAPPSPWRWSLTLRSEWAVLRRGLPVNSTDRFFSAHTATHYAVYLWQPAGPAGGGAPYELLLVWDMARPPARRPPAEDPAGSAPPGPALVCQLARRELAFYGALQGRAPRLRSLALDGRNLYVVEEAHRWAAGPQAPPRPPRAHHVRSTGIPVIPAPADPGLPAAAASAAAAAASRPVQGPRWVDECGADGGANMAFCRRARLSATAATNAFQPHAQPILRQQTAWASTGHGQLCADETFGAPPPPWPGWAPCWRHEDFPYLTVAEMVDFAAGLRVSAQACLMLQAASAHARPALVVRGLCGLPGPEDDGWDADGDGGQGGGAGSGDGREGQPWAGDGDNDWGGGSCSPAGLAVKFAEGTWLEFLGSGHIAGDERWLVGQDRQGVITIGRF